MKYYKFLTVDNKGEFSEFDYTKYLPDGDKPGEWLPEIDNIVICENGYHACKADDLLGWINAQLFEVELAGEIVEGNNKTVAQKMRIICKVETWNDKTTRLYACWCARDVLPLFVNKYPDDNCPRLAIETAKRYAEGNATEQELMAARAAMATAMNERATARDAVLATAWAAAWDAALDAAWDAALATTRDAAWDAARGAAMATAMNERATARDAVWDKYAKHLMEVLGLEVE